MEDREIMLEFNKMAESISLPEELSGENMMKKVAHLYYKKEVKKQKCIKNIIKYTGISFGAVAAAAIMFIICLNTVGVMGIVYDDGLFGMSQHVFNTRVDDNGFRSLRNSYNLRTYFTTNKIACFLNDMKYSLKGSFTIGDVYEAPGYSTNIGGSWSDSLNYDYVDTEVRTDGVAEGDVVVTNGKYIFSYGDVHRSKYRKIQVISADGEASEFVNIISVRDYVDEDVTVREMYICNDMLVIICETGEDMYDSCVKAVFLDVSEVTNPKHLSTFNVDGKYETSRITEGYLYVFTSVMYKDTSNDFIPKINGEKIKKENIYLGNIDYTASLDLEIMYNVLTSVSLEKRDKPISTIAVLSNCSQEYYVSAEGIYMYYQVPSVLSVCWCHNSTYFSKDEDKTFIMKIKYDEGKIKPEKKVVLDGEIDDSFCIDEHNGYLRVVTTVDKRTSNASSILYILDDKFKVKGSIKDIAKGEDTSSALFLGDMGYFVTHKNKVIDPLFSVDLSDPENPKILGALELSGYTEYMRQWSEDQLIGFGFTGEDSYNKISIFDVSDPLNLKEISVFKGEEDENIKDMNPGNYKSKLVSPEKNIIGFYSTADSIKSQTTDEYSSSDTSKYYICSIENNQLVLKKAMEFPSYKAYFSVYAEHTRGICIEDYIYVIVPGYKIYLYNIEQNEVISEIDISI